MVLADPGLIVPVVMGPLWNCPRVVLGMVKADRAISIAFDGLYRSGFRDLVDHEVTPPAQGFKLLFVVIAACCRARQPGDDGADRDDAGAEPSPCEGRLSAATETRQAYRIVR